MAQNNIETPELSESSKDMSLTQKEVVLWQNRMLPLMQKMIIGLTFFFFVASLSQLIYLHRSILSSPKIDIKKTLDGLATSDKNTFRKKQKLPDYKY
jgi:hypothetical protein